MRKSNAKTTVPLDVVPERRTKRCSPRFRPGGRFCELSFRYQSSPTGREGEISRPLDHLWQIPFIRPTRVIVSTNFYLYTTVFQLFLPYGMCKWVSVRCVLQLRMPFFQKNLSQGSFQFWLLYELLRMGTRNMTLAHVHLFSRQKSLTKRLRTLRSLLSLSFLNFQQKPVAVPNIYQQLHDRPRWKEKENRE